MLSTLPKKGMMDSMPKGTCLKFVRAKDINLIPRYLFEQVKPMDFDIDALYKWAPIIYDNPMNILGAFLDSENKVKGVMICSFNPVNQTIIVPLLSVDKEYYGKGILKEADGILNKFKRTLGAKKISIVTTRPHAMEKIGYAKSSVTMMEK